MAVCDDRLASEQWFLDGKPVGAAHGADVGTDGVARFDRSGMLRLVAGASRRRHAEQSVNNLVPNNR